CATRRHAGAARDNHRHARVRRSSQSDLETRSSVRLQRCAASRARALRILSACRGAHEECVARSRRAWPWGHVVLPIAPWERRTLCPPPSSGDEAASRRRRSQIQCRAGFSCAQDFIACLSRARIDQSGRPCQKEDVLGKPGQVATLGVVNVEGIAAGIKPHRPWHERAAASARVGTLLLKLADFPRLLPCQGAGAGLPAPIPPQAFPGTRLGDWPGRPTPSARLARQTAVCPPSPSPLRGRLRAVSLRAPPHAAASAAVVSSRSSDSQSPRQRRAISRTASGRRIAGSLWGWATAWNINEGSSERSETVELLTAAEEATSGLTSAALLFGCDARQYNSFLKRQRCGPAMSSSRHCWRKGL
ncbi:uncharacterized protein LOC133361741, partial [Lethenteron reissneri]|uniref:uncharacterized protein LOC133361741 n=1 Tax=Lethenteron reissneri TaxID=7753 RepID=UPI002AB66EBA